MKRKHTIIIIFVIFWVLLFTVPAVFGGGDSNMPDQKQIIIEVQPTTQPQIQPNASNVALDWAKVLIPALVAVAVVAVPVLDTAEKAQKG